MENKLKVIGPTDITEMVNGKTRIILISDIHHNYKVKSCKKKKDSILTTELIENLISKDKNKQWDFYLETGSSSPSFLYEKYNVRMNQFKDEYLNCKNSNSKENYCYNMFFVFYYFASKGCFLKKKCVHENTRFHFINIRQNFFDNININVDTKLDIHLYINNFFDFNDIEYLKELINRDFTNYLNYLKNVKKLINKDRKNNKIMKQILNSEQSESIYTYFFKSISDHEEFLDILIKKFNKNNINKFINNFINLLQNYKSFSELYQKKVFKTFNNGLVEILDLFFGKDLKKTKDFYKNHFKDSEDDEDDFYFYILNHINTVLMSFYVDLYTLGRMFRKFDGKKQNNVIVLAGRDHIDEYKKFLKSIKFKTKFVSEKENFRCQIIPNIL